MTLDTSVMTADTAGILATILAALYIPYLLLFVRAIPVGRYTFATRPKLGVALLIGIGLLSLLGFFSDEFSLVSVINSGGEHHADAASTWNLTIVTTVSAAILTLLIGGALELGRALGLEADERPGGRRD